MSRIKRRRFLQLAGTLTALGINQMEVMRQSDRYGKVLAQSTSRKLALLVGINEYPDSDRFGPLKGCVTDVNLQRELLIYRFGFNPKDILTVTDAKASRDGLLTAFNEHLIKQAKPGDVVVFHYSGHGSQIPDPNPINPDGLNSTFVPADDRANSQGIVQDIMGRSLFLLMSALQTENVTAILDSCHSGGGTRGNIRVRAALGGSEYKPSPAELEYQNKWLSQLKMSPQEFHAQRFKGVAKGVVIASTQRDEEAADAAIEDFYAGAFTYSMTQYLWQQTGNALVNSTIANVGRSTNEISARQDNKQNPLVEVKDNSGYQQKPLYFTNIQKLPAEAVITAVLPGNRAKAWLGGLGPESLAAFQAGATFTVVSPNTRRESGKVELISRQGLEGEVTWQGAVEPGTFLQEAVRAVPTDLKLYIGLDPSLGSSVNDALPALKALNRIEPVPSKPGNVPYEGEVQYIFGRLTPRLRQEFNKYKVADVPVEGSLGLFSPALEVIPGSFGVPGENGADAIKRLQSKFKSLLAARIVKMTLNTSSSRLKVEVSMSPEKAGTQLVAQSFTTRAGGQPGQSTRSVPALPADSQKLPLNTPIQFRIKNNETKPLYISVLVIAPDGEMTVVFPNQWAAASSAMLVAANTELLVPNPDTDDFVFVTEPPKGDTEVLVIASLSPLDKALKTLQSIAPPDRRGPVKPNEPVDVVNDFLDDLDPQTRGESDIGARQQVRNLKTAEMATLSITFEVT